MSSRTSVQALVTAATAHGGVPHVFLVGLLDIAALTATQDSALLFALVGTAALVRGVLKFREWLLAGRRSGGDEGA